VKEEAGGVKEEAGGVKEEAWGVKRRHEELLFHSSCFSHLFFLMPPLSLLMPPHF
jgi:hypothetical protein